MRTSMLVPVFVEGTPGFMWRWRALDGKSESGLCFEYFHQCMEDARRCGYVVDMPATLESARTPVAVSREKYRAAPVRG